MNGDGRRDVLVGAPYCDNNGREDSGSAYIVFGQASATTVDLAELGQRGFRIDGAADDEAGDSVARAGDVNGDGRSDVVVGASGADSAYVVFGKADTQSVDLASLGSGGFRIGGDGAGASVAGAGDVNGDGRRDVLVGAPFADKNERRDSGSAYVVFGKADTQSVDLASLGSGGLRIDGAAAGDGAGASVAGAGDVNGDGRSDVLVGAWLADNHGRRGSGSAYVVFGRANTKSVDLASLGSGGFRIDGAIDGDHVGETAAGVGDVNGDGRPDVLVSANGRRDPGSAAYVVFGKADRRSVDLFSLGQRGFLIGGVVVNGGVVAVAGAGDVNTDGRPDVLVGAWLADNHGRRNSGSAYVLFGKVYRRGVYLPLLGGDGFRIDGAAAYNYAGSSVAGAGDVNGDGRADVLVGAPYGDNNGRGNSGSAYLVFGKASTKTVDLGR